MVHACQSHALQLGHLSPAVVKVRHTLHCTRHIKYLKKFLEEMSFFVRNFQLFPGDDVRRQYRRDLRHSEAVCAHLEERGRHRFKRAQHQSDGQLHCRGTSCLQTYRNLPSKRPPSSKRPPTTFARISFFNPYLL